MYEQGRRRRQENKPSMMISNKRWSILLIKRLIRPLLFAMHGGDRRSANMHHSLSLHNYSDVQSHGSSPSPRPGREAPSGGTSVLAAADDDDAPAWEV
jgi:hypothetical protein